MRNAITVVLILITSLFAENLLLIRGNNREERQIETALQSKLPAGITLQVEKPTVSLRDMRNALANHPALVVITDPGSAVQFQTYQAPRAEIQPAIIVTDEDNYNRFRSIKGVTTIARESALKEFDALARRENIPFESIGVIYTASAKAYVADDIEQFRKIGKTVETVALTGEVSAASIENALDSFTSRKKWLIWIAGREMRPYLADETVRTELLERAAVTVVNSDETAKKLSSHGTVFSYASEPQTVATLIAASAVRTVVIADNAGTGDLSMRDLKTRVYKNGTVHTVQPVIHRRANALLSSSLELYRSKNRVATTPDTAVKESLVVASTKAVAPKTESPKVTETKTTKSEPVVAKAQPSSKKSQTHSAKTTTAKELMKVSITASLANVFASISPEPTLLAVAQSGDVFTVIDSVDSYLKIKAWGKTGYIAKSAITPIEIVPDPWYFTLKEYTQEIAMASVAIAVVLIAILIVSVVVARRKRLRKLHFNSAVILSKKPREIQIFDDKLISLKKYLFKHGTLLKGISSLGKFERKLIYHMPNIIIVDWDFSGSIGTVLQNTLSRYRLSSATTLILYNVKNASVGDFGDTNVLSFPGLPDEKLITLIQSKENENRTTVSKEDLSYLTGTIHDDNLSDILQLIETGRKTGGLVIEDSKPYAVLFFREGVIVYAATRDKLEGVNAVLASLRKEGGRFHFELNKQPPIANTELSALAILMQKSAMEDRMKQKRTAR